jgi:ABC-type phosphate transport system substrate-binding protein
MVARSTAIGVLVAMFLASPSLAGEVAVIVHVDRKVKLTRAEVAQIYLKRRRFWENGEAIMPVNRDSASDERARFVRLVFGKEADRLEVYWNRQYFQGVLPPATLASDDAVKRFVASEPLAIGYIASELVDGSVRVVLRIDEPKRAASGR